LAGTVGENENTPSQTPINLGQWLQQVFEDAWLAVEEALGMKKPVQLLVLGQIASNEQN